MAKKSGKKSSSSSEKKSEVVVVEDPVVQEAAAPVEPEVVVEAKPAPAAPAHEESPFDAFFQQMRERLNSIEKECKEMRSFVKKAELTYRRTQKQTQLKLRNATTPRRRHRREPNAVKRAPSGIAKPAKISGELAKFLNVDPETFMARTEVIKKIAQYIKEHKLENPDNRRQINPDKPLAKLLGSGKNDTVTYFNLQRFMKRHFPKQDEQVAA